MEWNAEWYIKFRESQDLSYKRSRKGLCIFEEEVPFDVLNSEHFKMCLFPRGDFWVLKCGKQNIKDSYCSSIDGDNFPKPANFNDYVDIYKYPTIVTVSEDGTEAIFTSKFCAWILALLILNNNKYSLFSPPICCPGRNYSGDPDIYYYNATTFDRDLNLLRLEFDTDFPFTTYCLLSMKIKDNKFSLVASPEEILLWYKFVDKYKDNAEFVSLGKEYISNNKKILKNDCCYTTETKQKAIELSRLFTNLCVKTEGIKLDITNPYDRSEEYWKEQEKK